MSKLIKSAQHDRQKSHIDGQLIDTVVQFGGVNEITLFHNEWTLVMNIDVDEKQIIFDAFIAPNTWLALGLAEDFNNAEVIQWIARDEVAEEDWVHFTSMSPINI